MAVEFETSNSDELDSTLSISTNVTVGAYPNRLLLVVVAVDSAETLDLVVNGSLVTTILTTLDGSLGRLRVYYKVAPDSGPNTASVTIGGVAVRNAAIGVSSYYNVNQTNPFGTVFTGTASAAPVIQLSNPLTADQGDQVVDWVSWVLTGGTTANAIDATIPRYNNGGASAVMGIASSDVVKTATDSQMGYAFSGPTNALYAAVSLRPEQSLTPDRSMPRAYFQSWS